MEPVQILYQDASVLVCRKPTGWLSEPGQGKSLPEALSQQLSEAGENAAVLTVHRLDKPVSGLMVLARTREAAGSLIAQIAAHTTEKEYLAVVCGVPEAPEGTWEDLLFHDSRTNKTFVVTRMRKGVREARLRYRVVETCMEAGQPLTLVRVELLTGRTHQIRAQFSHRGLPLLGDVRYGSRARPTLALFSCHLAFDHPETGKRMEWKLQPSGPPWDLFGTVEL